jgi:hypothetical protein
MDKMNVNISLATKRRYVTLFDTYKAKSSRETKEKSTDEAYAVPTFKEFLRRIRETFDEGSIQVLVAEMYGIPEAIARDDFGDLTIIKADSEENNENNFIVVPKSSNSLCVIIINEYKTSSKYGKIRIVAGASVSKLIRAYIAKHNIKYGEKLFNYANGSLSQFISIMVKKVGLDGGINTIRKMKSTDARVANPNMTDEERVRQANKAMHGVNADDGYQRQQEVQKEVPVKRGRGRPKKE